MDGEHFLQVVSRRLGLAPPMHLSKTPAARDLHAIAELLAARAPLGVALVLDAASQHLGGLVLDARHRVCADAFTPRSVRQELRAAGVLLRCIGGARPSRRLTTWRKCSPSILFGPLVLSGGGPAATPGPRRLRADLLVLSAGARARAPAGDSL